MHQFLHESSISRAMKNVIFQRCGKNIRDLYYGENQYFLSSIKFCKITVTKNRSFLATFLFPSSLRKQKINGDLQEYDINWIFSNFCFSKIFLFITCYQESLSAYVLGGGWFAAFTKMIRFLEISSDGLQAGASKGHPSNFLKNVSFSFFIYFRLTN